jgi:hypothetical protein
MITNEMKVAAVKAYTEVDGKCRPAAMQKALEAALSTLPIAGEGKAPEELSGPLQWAMADAFEASAADTTAGKMIAVYDVVRSALISSPGKDGGQEVEAVEWQGRYWIEDEGRWSNWITNPVGYRWAHEPQEGKSEIRYLYPQPASTALVERLTSALLKAEEVLANYADPTGYTDGYGDLVPADAVQHEGLLAQEALDVVRSALSASQSTSREGER